MKQPLTTDEILIGQATYGLPRRVELVLEPTPTVCLCGTDNETGPCPGNCPTLHEEKR